MHGHNCIVTIRGALIDGLKSVWTVNGGLSDDYGTVRGCEQRYLESEMAFERVPGATVAYCPECQQPTKEKMFL